MVSPFPSTVIKLYGLSVRHPWLDVAGVVSNHPRLRPWEMNNSVGKLSCLPTQSPMRKQMD